MAVDYDALTFPEAIAVALHSEFGRDASAIKRVSRITKANERAVRNWFDGKNAPSGEHLISLIHHSDEAFAIVLARANRPQMVLPGGLPQLRQRLADLIEIIDRIQTEGTHT